MQISTLSALQRNLFDAEKMALSLALYELSYRFDTDGAAVFYIAIITLFNSVYYSLVCNKISKTFDILSQI